MKKIIALIITVIGIFSLVSCNGSSDAEKYYPNTELVELETFTSVTGIELNITENCPESNSVNYNYLMGNNADGLGAVLKYESYLSEYGFNKSDALSTKDSNVYLMDEYIIVTATFSPQDNVIQYVVNIPNGKLVSEDDSSESIEAPQDVDSTVSEPPKNESLLYTEFCRLVDESSYIDAIQYRDDEQLSLDYENTQDYYQYAKAMNLYKETEFLTYQDIMEVTKILREDVSEGFKDSAELIENIDNELATLLGTHVSKRNSNYAYDAYYLIITDNGEVTLDLGKSNAGEPMSSSVTHQLVYVNLENGSFYMLCRRGLMDIDYCDYAITILPDYLALSKAWGSVDDGLFADNYRKES